MPVNRCSWSLIIFCTAPILLTVGCYTKTTEGPQPAVRVRDQRASTLRPQRNKVVIVDDDLQQWKGEPDDQSVVEDWFNPSEREAEDKYSKVAVEKTNANRTETGTVEAWATIRNRTDYQLNLQARTLFYSSEGQVIDKTAWNRFYIEQNGIENYSGLSKMADRIDFYTIELREGD